MPTPPSRIRLQPTDNGAYRILGANRRDPITGRYDATSGRERRELRAQRIAEERRTRREH